MGRTDGRTGGRWAHAAEPTGNRHRSGTMCMQDRKQLMSETAAILGQGLGPCTAALEQFWETAQYLQQHARKQQSPALCALTAQQAALTTTVRHDASTHGKCAPHFALPLKLRAKRHQADPACLTPPQLLPLPFAQPPLASQQKARLLAPPVPCAQRAQLLLEHSPPGFPVAASKVLERTISQGGPAQSTADTLAGVLLLARLRLLPQQSLDGHTPSPRKRFRQSSLQGATKRGRALPGPLLDLPVV